ncbi:MAG: caspase family protein [Bacteroidetes bacterium]|nr:caspase family protein [Bacteroidota bacterium]
MAKSIRNQLTAHFPASHAFLVGVQDYRYVAPLQTPVNDIKSLAEVLQIEAHGFHVHELLINPEKEALETYFETTIPGIVKENDRVLIYFAGHGIAIDEAGQTEPKGFLLPVDARRSDEHSFTSMAFLNMCLQKLPCRHLLLLLDCCFAGSFQWAVDQTRGYGRDSFFKTIYRQRYEYFLQEPAWQAIASSAYHQRALDVAIDYALGQREKVGGALNSPFAETLVVALRDGAGDRSPSDGLMTVSEIFAYLQDQLVQFSHLHIQKPVFFPLRNHRQGEFIFLNPKVKLHLADYSDDYNPYRGLESYEHHHRNLFYGRDRVIEDLMEVLNYNSLLIVSGDSGAGKSSLVRAGLMPELELRGYRLLHPIRPGMHPLESLETAVKEASDKPSDLPSILLVDQLEELASSYVQGTERTAFLSFLSSELEQQRFFQKIILTVRSDFETFFEQSPLSPYWNRTARYPIPGFEYAELEDIVLCPMQERCITYEKDLTAQLIREVQNKIGGLPLLSFALFELYECFKGRRLNDEHFRTITWKDYQSTGGVVGALEKRADHIYERFDDIHRSVFRKVILRLVSNENRESGRRVLADEITYRNSEENQCVSLILESLIDARLLVTGTDYRGDRFIEPAHDALIRSWNRLRLWIDEFKDYLPLRDQLIAKLTDYRQSGGKETLLMHNDPRLAQLEDVRNRPQCWYNAQEDEYVLQSIAWREKKKRENRRIRAYVFSGLSFLLLLACLFGIQSFIANQDLKVKQISLQHANTTILNQRDSLIRREYENNIAKGLEAQSQKRFVDALSSFQEAIQRCQNDSLLLDSLPIALSCRSRCQKLAADDTRFQELSTQAESLIAKNDDRDLGTIIEIYRQSLQKEVDASSKAVIVEKIRQLETRRDQAFTKTMDIAAGRVRINEPCSAFFLYQKANQIKPGQSEALQKMHELKSMALNCKELK